METETETERNGEKRDCVCVREREREDEKIEERKEKSERGEEWRMEINDRDNREDSAMIERNRERKKGKRGDYGEDSRLRNESHGPRQQTFTNRFI